MILLIIKAILHDYDSNNNIPLNEILERLETIQGASENPMQPSVKNKLAQS